MDENSKVSRLKQWEQVKKSSGIIPKGLTDKPQMIDEVCYLWENYLDVRKGSEKISYRDLVAYIKITGNELSPWECSIILDIDGIWHG